VVAPENAAEATMPVARRVICPSHLNKLSQWLHYPEKQLTPEPPDCIVQPPTSADCSGLSESQLMTYAALNLAQENLLAGAITSLKLSPRGVHKVLRVARTIADLDVKDTIEKNHLLEALSYRRLDVLSMESQHG